MEFLQENYQLIATIILFAMSELIGASKLKANSVTGIVMDILKMVAPKKDKIEQPK